MEPTDPSIAATMQSMKDRGIGMLYGRWLIEGAPRVLLIDTKTAYGYMNEWKADLWQVASIPSPPDDAETNEAVVFGYLVAWFLGEVRFLFTEMGSPNLDLILTMSSLFVMRRRKLSLPIFTSGLPVLACLSVKDDELTSRPSSLRTLLCWDDTFAQVLLISTTTCSGSMLIQRLENVGSTTVIALSVPLLIRVMSSPLCPTSLPSSRSTC